MIQMKGKIFIIDDDELIVSMLSRAFKNEGYEVYAETEPRDIVNKIKLAGPDVVMLDIKLPEHNGMDILEELKLQEVNASIIMLTADDSAESAIKAMKLGAADYLTKPFNLEEVKIVIANLIEKERLKREVDYLRRVNSGLIEKEIVGNSAIMGELKEKIEKIAMARVSTVLITGESGTGKELVARYIHHHMYGNNVSEYAPFIGINCAALPESLLESELFGYEKGSFTDAKTDKKGVFELAHEGTLLLDEIGDMKPNLQSKLLRVLEERMIRHIGGKKDIPVNATVIATTNRNLSEAVEKGDFRMDLFYRLNTFHFHIPPLRERREDILVLANYFLSFFTARYYKKSPQGFSAEARNLMVSYEWPGNVRELKNVIERIIVLERAEVILPEHLPLEIVKQRKTSEIPVRERFTLPAEGISLEDLERELVIQALERTKYNRTMAAKLLNITYDSLRYQMKKFGLG